MVLSKQLGVFLNFVHNKFKQKVNDVLSEAGYDITAEQYLLLDTLWTEGPLPQQRIADIMLKDKNSVVKLVDSLEARGYVRRVANPSDRRQNIISATSKGERIQEPTTAAAMRAIGEITQRLTEEEINTFIKALDVMANNMDPDIDLLEIAKEYPTKKRG